VQMVRIVLMLAAAAAIAGQYAQERYRLLALQRLPGDQARDRYEVRRRRSERVMYVVTVLAALAGVVALADLFVGQRMFPP
jgi:Ni/Fe-hydrogenase subunit HybB-like protein